MFRPSLRGWIEFKIVRVPVTLQQLSFSHLWELSTTFFPALALDIDQLFLMAALSPQKAWELRKARDGVLALPGPLSMSTQDQAQNDHSQHFCMNRCVME